MPSSWHHVTLRNSPQHIMRTLCTCCVYMLLGSRVTVGMTTADCVVQCMYGTGVQLVVPNCVVEGQNRTICLSVCLSVCRSVGRSVCLSVCLAGWLAVARTAISSCLQGLLRVYILSRCITTVHYIHLSVHMIHDMTTLRYIYSYFARGQRQTSDTACTLHAARPQVRTT